MPIHVVQQGECVNSIAYRHGFAWETVWKDPQNAGLRRKRQIPGVLSPGDEIFIPELRSREESCATEKRHRFKVKGVPAKLRLRLMKEPEPAEEQSGGAQETIRQSPDGRELTIETEPRDEESQEDEPWADAPYVLQIDGRFVKEGRSDDDGRIEVSIPPDAMRGRLIVAQGTEKESIIPLNLGHLDPIETVAGVKQRLFNLGFDCGGTQGEETPELENAVRLFQAKRGLEETGEMDDQLRDALREAHGS